MKGLEDQTVESSQLLAEIAGVTADDWCKNQQDNKLVLRFYLGLSAFPELYVTRAANASTIEGQEPAENMRQTARLLRHELEERGLLSVNATQLQFWYRACELLKRAELPTLQSAQEIWPYPPLTPYPHQTYAADWVAERRGNCVIGLDTGLGKTFITELIMRRMPSVAEGHDIVFFTVPDRVLISQQRAPFVSGKFGPLGQKLLSEERLHVGTPQSFLKRIPELQDSNQGVLLLVDEGDIGIRAGTGKYATFRLAQDLGIVENPPHRRLVAFSATVFSKEFEEYTRLMGVQHILSPETDTTFANLVDEQRCKRWHDVYRVPSTRRHGAIAEAFAERASNFVRPLQQATVNADPEHRGLPYFKAPDDPNERKLPRISRENATKMLQRLEKIRDGTFENPVTLEDGTIKKLNGKVRRGLLGLWERRQCTWNPEVQKQAERDISTYLSSIRRYMAAFELFDNIQCSSYAGFTEKMHDEGDRILCTKARELLKTDNMNIPDIRNLINKHRAIETEMTPLLDELHKALLCYEYGVHTVDEDLQETAHDRLKYFLSQLATKAPNHPPEGYEVEHFFSPDHQKAMRGIQLTDTHPKEDVYLRVLKDLCSDTRNRILTVVRYRATLYRLITLTRKHGLPSDYLIGGSLKSTAIHNLIAQRRFEEGDVLNLIGSPVINRGKDLQGANKIVIYDLSFSIREHIQRIGRGGRGGRDARTAMKKLLDRPTYEMIRPHTGRIDRDYNAIAEGVDAHVISLLLAERGSRDHILQQILEDEGDVVVIEPWETTRPVAP